MLPANRIDKFHTSPLLGSGSVKCIDMNYIKSSKLLWFFAPILSLLLALPLFSIIYRFAISQQSIWGLYQLGLLWDKLNFAIEKGIADISISFVLAAVLLTITSYLIYSQRKYWCIVLTTTFGLVLLQTVQLVILNLFHIQYLSLLGKLGYIQSIPSIPGYSKLLFASSLTLELVPVVISLTLFLFVIAVKRQHSSANTGSKR